MSNDFQSIQSGGGLLKNDYQPGDSPASLALKRRQQSLKNKIIVPTKDRVEGVQDDVDDN